MKKVYSKILINKTKLQRKIKELAKTISSDYKGKDLILIGMLKGCNPFFSDLIKELTIDVKITYFTSSSYEGMTSTHTFYIKSDIDIDIKDADVLIIEDIVDSGYSINQALKYFNSKEPKSIKLCSLLSKPSRRIMPVNIDYLGFEIEDLFVIGYGLDYNQLYRNLPFIAVYNNA